MSLHAHPSILSLPERLPNPDDWRLCPQENTWCAFPFDRAMAESETIPYELRQDAKRLEKLFDALEEAAKDIPRDTFDL